MAEINTNSKERISIINIKSDFILKQIFENLQKNKLLNIIRYNKNLQKKLNKNIDDYKEEYSKIEIEIIMDGFGDFINFREDESYYHIFLMMIKNK